MITKIDTVVVSSKGLTKKINELIEQSNKQREEIVRLTQELDRVNNRLERMDIHPSTY